MNTFKLDQHFLKDEKVLNQIILAAELKKDDDVLEIGPGKGILTSLLAGNARKIITVELDKSFKPYLDELPRNVEVYYGNALELMNTYKFNKIVSNLPYAISEPLLKKLLKLDFELAVLLISQSFYGLLIKESKWSIITPVFFDISKITSVPKDSFEPKPRADSVIIVLKKRQALLSFAEQIIKELVLQDDKKLINALVMAFVRVHKLSQKQAKARVAELELDEKLLGKRVEHLSNRQFSIVSSKLSS